MKWVYKVLIFLIAVLVIGFAVYVVKQVSEPQSAIIFNERLKLTLSIDKVRAEQDPVYASEMEGKLRRLDYRLALAYNAEAKPDEAVALLRDLINREQARGRGGARRSSRSYFDEARYYEALKESYDIKKDAAGAQKADEMHRELLAKGEEVSRRERREEGRSVESPAE